ncbi:MAG: AAA family ATPase [Lachnospiraceae bacterium]|nr:AAA family ATPase [Robinsoniella sp.]MDY3767603.1 AAA family ATPase [Lachnospiraceae bacterium]
MRKSVCIQFFEKYLREVSAGRGYRSQENPAFSFTKNAKAGEFDHLSDAEYEALLKETEELSKIWLMEKNQTASNVLRICLENIEIDQESLHRLAEILAECYASSIAPFVPENQVPSEERIAQSKYSGEEEDDWFEEEEKPKSRKNPSLSKHTSQFSEMKKTDILTSPRRICDYLADQIHGQKEAVKAASLLLYNHTHGRKRNLLFVGPTGCGKTEIWRVCQQIYPHIHIVDSTMITAEGWTGNFKLRDIFAGMGREEAEKCVIVFDEFDKFCEPKFGSGGTNHSLTGQNELLKLIEGSKIFFPANGGKPDLEIDSSKISFVFCGSFECLTEMKADAESSVSIGFGGNIEKTDAHSVYESQISQDDLVKYAGVRQEIAGRINQIVQLSAMTAEDYKTILSDRQISPLYQLERQYGVKLLLDTSTRQQLAKEAEENHMGVRYLRSRIQQMLDDQMFQDCEKAEYQLQIS